MRVPRSLEWDSEFFGFGIAALDADEESSESLRAAIDWCRRSGVRCLVVRASTLDRTTARAAATEGLQYIDSLVTLTLDPSRRVSTSRVGIRIVESPERDVIDQLAAIARASFTDSRFLFDHRFPETRVHDMYEARLRARCGETGTSSDLRPAEATIVSGDGPANGFVSCLVEAVDVVDDDGVVRDGAVGVIDLLAVAQAARGRGIAEAMTRAAVDWFAGRGCREVRVATQGRNVVAQRLYQRCGFVVDSMTAFYHGWLEPAD